MLDKSKISLGIAPIGWTNDDMPDLGGENTFQQCVSEMALAGFTGCEVGSKFPTDVPELKKALDLRGLQVCNCWFSSFLISKPFEETEKDFIEKIDFLNALGAKVIGVSEQSYSTQGILTQPIFEEKHVMNDAEWDLLCDGLNKLGKIAKDKGMSLTFHHHMGTVVQNEDEIDRFMRSVDPELVFLLFDSGHCTFAGIDPVKVLTKYIDRTRHIHLKDVRFDVVAKAKTEKWSFLDCVRKGAFTVPGDGDVDFSPLFKIIVDSAYTGYVLVEAEQDPAIANPLEYAIKARKYIAEKTGL
ncbi:MAG: myo-inosose-2 dehydratase [Lachnospiraceae bacterium]